MKSYTHGTITVKVKTGPLKLLFSCEKAYTETAHKLRQEGFEILEAFWGYALYDSSKEAMEVVRIFNA